MNLSKEAMRIYQQNRRANKKVGKIACKECARLTREIAALTKELNEERAKKELDAIHAAGEPMPDLRTHHPACKCAICRPPK